MCGDVGSVRRSVVWGAVFCVVFVVLDGVRGTALW